MKNKENMAGMFDDTEPYMPGQQQEEGIANKQEPSAEAEISDTYGYLQKLLELEREIAVIQHAQHDVAHIERLARVVGHKLADVGILCLRLTGGMAVFHLLLIAMRNER